MKQFLLKALEVMQQLVRASIDIGSRVLAMLRSVNIDLQRAVILCVTLQLIVAMSLLVVFHNRTGPMAKPLDGQSEPQTLQPAEPAGSSIPDPRPQG